MNYYILCNHYNAFLFVVKRVPQCLAMKSSLCYTVFKK